MQTRSNLLELVLLILGSLFRFRCQVDYEVVTAVLEMACLYSKQFHPSHIRSVPLIIDLPLGLIKIVCNRLSESCTESSESSRDDTESRCNALVS